MFGTTKKRKRTSILIPQITAVTTQNKISNYYFESNFPYLCTVQLRKKILSYFLLATYLLVVLHQSVSHSHALELGETPSPEPAHQHDDFQTVHHEHDFHIGIFHFFGHLFEHTNHSNDLADEHLVISQKSPTKIIVDNNHSVNAPFYGNNLMIFDVDAESLPDPPNHLSLLQKLIQPNTPLRAPPARVYS